MSGQPKLLSASALVAVSAGAFVLSFPPHDFAFLPWIALVPLFLALQSTGRRGAALFGVAWTLLVAIGIAAWLPRAIAVYWQQPYTAGLAVLLGAASLMGAIQYSIFAVAFRMVGGSRIPSALAVGAMWVAAEFARSRMFGGCPWAILGSTLVPPLTGGSSYADVLRLPVQIADLGGVEAVSFVIASVNAAIASLLDPWWNGSAPPAYSRRKAAMAAVLASLSMLYGHQRLRGYGDDVADQAIAVVQGNVSLAAAWRSEFYGRNFDVYLRATGNALAESPRLVVWPENAMSFFVEDDALYRASFAQVASPKQGDGVEILAGGPSRTPGESPRYFNSMFLLSNGEIRGRYDKQHLLELAEHFPFGARWPMHRDFGEVREFSPGPNDAPLATAAGNAGILLCNEILFDRLSNARVAAGAEFLVNPSNDGWIHDAGYSLQHLATGQARAIETRRWIVRASTSGPSAVIAPNGRVTALSAAGELAVLQGSIGRSSAITPFVRLGDLFAWGCVLASAWRILLATRHR